MAIKVVVVCDVCGDTGWSAEVVEGMATRTYQAAVDALNKPMNGRQWKRVGDKWCCSIRCAGDAWEPPRCSCERPVNPENDRRGDYRKCLVCGGQIVGSGRL